jgi:hypothetical protein
MEVRTTADGILRAFGLLVGQASAPRQIKPKFAYRSNGSAIHSARCLTKAEHEIVDDLVAKLRKLDPQNDEETKEYQALLKELSKQPVKFVPLKYGQRIVRSKTYPYRSKKRGG